MLMTSLQYTSNDLRGCDHCGRFLKVQTFMPLFDSYLDSLRHWQCASLQLMLLCSAALDFKNLSSMNPAPSRREPGNSGYQVSQWALFLKDRVAVLLTKEGDSLFAIDVLPRLAPSRFVHFFLGRHSSTYLCYIPMVTHLCAYASTLTIL
ncbi:hypothetical protein K443DRAFT_681009 [Laccaria amethystina LaAM-08-1]|uniref:Uncharacterized protein n=1 Tax=Laccaria amethystina LaAM-08-1 TaxID=1095629 RepID=A0A0C9X9N4_9AGAR|nr:hypothetical protein K443DRAFT_681009 [Laccaria amethystina LaAM-08-1]